MDKNKSLILYEGEKTKYIPGEFSIALLRDIFGDLLYIREQENKRRYANMDWTPVHYEWDENGVHYSEWKIGPMFTNDAGYEQFNEAVS